MAQLGLLQGALSTLLSACCSLWCVPRGWCRCLWTLVSRRGRAAVAPPGANACAHVLPLCRAPHLAEARRLSSPVQGASPAQTHASAMPSRAHGLHLQLRHPALNGAKASEASTNWCRRGQKVRRSNASVTNALTGFVKLLRLKRSSGKRVPLPGPAHPLGGPLRPCHFGPTRESFLHLLTRVGR